MYLKTLTLRGFKSFASATTMRLEPGITCVVGPNGSGKSNVVDALTWVMGEQGAKNLRGGSMTDVIFAGTTSRPALGRAEVSLTIDNSDGLLPIDYSEVEISRILFKNGGSEYAINGSPCRLLDIQELLSDTGMGRSMHVIVGQGRLDSILQASALERRAFIEEAAGVLKHRRRKEKALRKIEQMQGNLLRLQDLTAEIRRQLGPLARQAQVARRAGIVQADLRDAKLRLLADDLVQAQANLDRDEAAGAGVKEHHKRLLAEHALAKQKVTEAQKKATVNAPQVAKSTEIWYALVGIRESLRSLVEVASERRRLIGQIPLQANRNGDDPLILESRAKAVREQEAQLEIEIKQAQANLETASAKRQELETKERQTEQHLAAINRGVADRREGIARLNGQVNARRERLDASEKEIARLLEVLEEAHKRIMEARADYAKLEAEIAFGETGGEQTESEYQRAKTQVEESTAFLEQLERNLSQLKADRAAALARAETLELTIQAGDAQQNVEKILALQIPGVGQRLTDALTVRSGWEEAVTAVLGKSLESVVVNDLHALKEVFRLTPEQQWGSLNLVLADDALNTATFRKEVSKQFEESKNRFTDLGSLPVVALLDLVQLKPGFMQVKKILQLLIGNFVVLQTELTAEESHIGLLEKDYGLSSTDWELVEKILQAGWDVVSKKGEIFSLRGFCSSMAKNGASKEEIVEQSGSSRLSLQNAREQALEIAEQLGYEIEQLSEQRTEKLTQLRLDKQVQDELSGKLHAAQARAKSLEEQLQRLASAIKSAQIQVEKTEPATQLLKQEIAQHTEEIEVLQARLEIAQTEPEAAESELTQVQLARDVAADNARQARAAETDARLQLRTLEERVGGLAGRAASLESAARAERRAREVAARKAEKRAAQAAAAAIVEDGAKRTLAALDAAVARAAIARDEANAARDKHDKEILLARELADDIAAELAKVTERLHLQDLELAEKRLVVQTLCSRAVEEIGIEPDVLVEEFGPHLPVPQLQVSAANTNSTANIQLGQEIETENISPTVPYVRAEQEARLAQAERDLKRLGKVNPLALEEHAALEERHQFLTNQLEDVRRSQADLRTLVKEIDERVEQVFQSAYEDTAKQFASIFPRLFPGGEGKLEITDPGDWLNTGIEIQARPAGKKVKRLSLLSGGERSLTAIALLVAIFMARPSPFYVMDEVEAALDDANLGRLLEVFRDLQANSQLIIITHQKRTMEIADALYGVTMGTDGVTTVVSSRLA